MDGIFNVPALIVFFFPYFFPSLGAARDFNRFFILRILEVNYVENVWF